jgi:hypothetical protein
MENQVIQNVMEHQILNSATNLSTVSLRHFIKRVHIACKTKGIETFDGLPIDEWRDMYYNKVGEEPMMRLIFRIMFALTSHNIFLVEVLNEDPELLISCFTNGDLAPYYEKYPQNRPVQ